MGANKKDTSDAGEAEEARKITRLRKKVGEARQVHAIADDPYLKVVELDRMRASITRTMWLLLAVGLGFTTTGVHDYIAAGLSTADPMWWGGWAVEPTFAGLLITLLRWETIMLSGGVAIGSGWVRGTKYTLLASTLIMNLLAGWAKGGVFVMLHLIIPALVFCLAEVMPVIQDRFTKARDKLLAKIKDLDTISHQTGQNGTVKPSPSSSVPSTVADLHAELDEHGSQPAPVSPGLPPVASPPAEVPPPVNLPRPKLPASTVAAIEAKAAELAAAGRTIAAADVQAVIKVPGAMAEQAAKYFAAAHTAA